VQSLCTGAVLTRSNGSGSRSGSGRKNGFSAAQLSATDKPVAGQIRWWVVRGIGGGDAKRLQEEFPLPLVCGEREGLFELIDKEIDRMSGIVQQLYHTYRRHSQPALAFDLAGSIADVLYFLDTAAKEKGYRVTLLAFLMKASVSARKVPSSTT
jgi:hypothetical protein